MKQRSRVISIVLVALISALTCTGLWWVVAGRDSLSSSGGSQVDVVLPSGEGALPASKVGGALDSMAAEDLSRRVIGGLDPAETAASEAEPPPVQSRILGRVLSATLDGKVGEPIEGAQVVYATGDPQSLGVDEQVTEASTGSDGRFSLPLEIWGTNVLTISAPGHLHRVRWMKPVRGRLDLGDILLREATTVSGRVQNAEGQGIAGARIVSIEPGEDDFGPWGNDHLDLVLGVSNSAGVFQVPAAAKGAPGDAFRLVVRHDSYATATILGSLEAYAVQGLPLIITMERGAAIRGRVTGYPGSSHPDSGAHAVVAASRALLGQMLDDWDYDPGQRRISIEPDGTFEVGGLLDGERVALSAWTGGTSKSSSSQRRTQWVLGVASRGVDGAEVLELEYRAPSRVTAQLVDASLRSIEWATIGADQAAVIRSSEGVVEWMTTSVIPGGRVEWTCAPVERSTHGPFRFNVEAPASSGMAPSLYWEYTVPALAAGEMLDLGQVILRELDVPDSSDAVLMRSIEVQVVDDQGRALAHRRVNLQTVAGDRSQSGQIRSRDTQAGGSLHFSVPVDDVSQVRLLPRYRGTSHLRRYEDGGFTVEGLSPWTPVPAGTGDATISLVEVPLAEVDLLVLYDGRPLDNAIVEFSWFPDSQARDAMKPILTALPQGERTDGAGAWRGDHFLTGAWRALVHHPQLRMSETFDFELARGGNSLKFVRAKTAVVGRIVCERGPLPAGMIVRSELGPASLLHMLHGVDPDRMVPRVGAGFAGTALRDIRNTAPRADGTFYLEGVTPGVELKVVVLAPGYLAASSKVVTVFAGETVDLGDVSLVPAGALRVELPFGHNGFIELNRIFGETGEGKAAAAALDASLTMRQKSVFDQGLVDHLAPGRWTVDLSYHDAMHPDDELEYKGTVDIRAGVAAQLSLK